MYEEAKNRIRWLYDEFDEVIVFVSGGKDSEVIMHLTHEIAEERGKTPVKVFWIDQEAEWDATVKRMRDIHKDPKFDLTWLQIPMKIWNATSYDKDWLNCWMPGEEWMREKEPYSVHENNYGTDRFGELFDKIVAYHFPEQSVASIGGVRTEESPGRHLGMTTSCVYKDVTWGKLFTKKKKQFVFYPIYDWSYTDVWKYIHDNNLPYNKIYDYQFRYGIPVRKMRVSNLNHEQAVNQLFYMQEVEPDTHERLTKRLPGIDSATKLGKEDFWVTKLPYMFKDWKEYRDYLCEKLIKPEHQKKFKDIFRVHDAEFEELPNYKQILKVHINAILSDDFYGVKLHNVYIMNNCKATSKIRKEKLGK